MNALINVTEVKRRNDKEMYIRFVRRAEKLFLYIYVYIYSVCKIGITYMLLNNVLHVDVIALSRQEREKDHQTNKFE